MAEKFTARLRRRGERIWRAIDGHPFLQQLHAGTLPMNRFTYFILQDYVYLLDFAQVLCHAGSKSPNLETLELFARHALGAVEVERSFHESFGRSLGLSPKQLDGVAKGPITQAYIGHLQSVARTGTLGEIVAAVLPCYWIYGEVGRRLYRNRPSKPKIYRQWIETYASEAFWKPVREQIRLTDKLGAAASSSEKKLMTAHFILSSRYEFMFWEQAYRSEKWPV
ncbi:MAG: thiaminase II [Deltaproteobacteria bacterium]|nr:MAG: thiaminase II [Deltaproteobacteria bacterium]